MNRYIAFLRAINVGGHNVKMDQLKSLFESMDFNNVETFIASGNVIFETMSTDIENLQLKIEGHLADALGYEVITFLRADQQIADIANYQPFTEDQMNTAVAFNIGFIKTQLDKNQVEKLFSFNTDIDDFHVNGSEIYWICKTKQSESNFDANKLQKSLGIPVTFRTIKTIHRLTVKYPPVK